jgi:phage terminase large subunit-like protein
MSPPHPAAVGTYGWDAVDSARLRGIELRYWQRLSLVRLLEHDATGQLVWLDALISTARQVGKSVGLRELALWRLHQESLFAEEQLVLHTGKDLQACREVQRPARAWAKQAGYQVREANNQEEICLPDGSRWLLRGQGSVYSYAASLAVADEAWGVHSQTVEEGLEPTLAERVNGQLVLFSTAHRRCTSLVPMRRAVALATWAHPKNTLLLEWSAPRNSDLEDRAAWRLASPHWTPGRERLLEGKLARVLAGHSEDPDEDDPVESFRSQFLNVWPARRLVATTRAEPLVDVDTWNQALDLYAPVPDGPLVVAIEDYFGLGAASAAAGVLPDGRVVTWGELHTSRTDAYAWAGFAIGRRDGCRVLVGASLPLAEAQAAVPEGTPVEHAGTAHTTAALPFLRSLVRAGRVAHPGSVDLLAQVKAVRLVPTSTAGLSVAHRGVRADLLKATAWCVAHAATPAAEPPEWFVY